ncbi:MAG: hypothetical protein IJ660_05955 [Alphaproteobacteria bacterium]|nr:hypothetical protein [Alphaproteobacteria bacterium]
MADKDENLKNVQLQANRWLAEKDKENVSFIQTLADKGESFDLSTLKGCLALKVKYEAWKKEQEQAPSHNNQADNKPVNSFNVTQNNAKSQTEAQNQIDNSWIAKKIQHWDNEWCQNKAIHDSEYVFEPVKADTELKFNVYKDKEKTQLGATVHYTSPTDVTLETEEGKVPDFEFFDKMVHEAVEKDGVPAVNFANADDMTPDFKAKLAIACIKHGIPMQGFDGKIDLNQLSPEERNSLGEDVTKKVGYHNKYVEAKEAAQAHQANAETKDKPFDLSTVADMNDAAIVFAAYKNAGITVDGIDKFTKDTHGMLIISDKEKKLMPQEVRDNIDVFNKKASQDTLSSLRKKINQATSDRLASGATTDLEKANIKGLQEERQKVEKARSFFGVLRKNENMPNDVISELRGDVRQKKDITTDNPARDMKLAEALKTLSEDDWKKLGFDKAPEEKDQTSEFKKTLQENQQILSNRAMNRQGYGIEFEEVETNKQRAADGSWEKGKVLVQKGILDRFKQNS